MGGEVTPATGAKRREIKRRIALLNQERFPLIERDVDHGLTGKDAERLIELEAEVTSLVRLLVPKFY